MKMSLQLSIAVMGFGIMKELEMISVEFECGG